MTTFIRVRRSLPVLLLSAVALTAMAQAPATPDPQNTPQRHEFVIHNFKTESGVVLPEAHIVYGTYGTLDAAHDNAVLLPSHYMANLTGYGFLIKSERSSPTARSTPPSSSSSPASSSATAAAPRPRTRPSPSTARVSRS